MYIHLILIIIIICSIVIQSIYYNKEPFENAPEKNIKMYVINLDRNVERYEEFVANYKLVMNDVDIERFPAVDGSSLSYKELEETVSPQILEGIKQIDETNQRKSYEQLTRGMIGCFLSHIKIYEKNIDKNDIVVIFEDDAKFDINIKEFVMNLKDTPEDWDIILLGTVNIFDMTVYSDSWNKIREFYGTAGYVINNNGMKKMLQYYKPIQHQIDYRMGELCKNGLLNIYKYKDNLVNQISIYSDVQMQVSTS